jgi:hypothetical protein
MSIFYENDGSSSSDVAGNVTFADASGILDTLASTAGKVADYGFKLQEQQYATQSKAQDLQLKSLMGNLGFQTAVVQTQSANTIAQIQAKTALSQAQKQSTVTSTTGLSPTMILLGFGGLALLMMQRK